MSSSKIDVRLWAFVMMAASLAIIAPLIKWFYWPVTGSLDVSHYQLGRDFINTWVGPRLAFRGGVLKLFQLHEYARLVSVEFGQHLPFHNWSYPPSSLLLMLPFASLPYGWALAAWSVLFLGVYAVVSLGYVEPGRRLLALALVLCAPASLINLIGGQNGFVTASLMLGGLAALRTRPLLAGVLFGLLTTKPHLGLVLACVLLSLKSWRTIAAAAVTALVLVAQSVLLFGWEPWRLYFTVTRGYQTLLLTNFGGFYTPMMASVTAMLRFVNVPLPAALMLQAVAALAVIGTTCWAVRRTSDPALRALIVAAATPLATPYAFNYDLTALSAMLVWRLTSATPLSPAARGVYVLAWIAPTGAMLLGFFGANVMPACILLAFVAVVGEVFANERRPWLEPKTLAKSDTSVEDALCTP